MATLERLSGCGAKASRSPGLQGLSSLTRGEPASPTLKSYLNHCTTRQLIENTVLRNELSCVPVSHSPWVYPGLPHKCLCWASVTKEEAATEGCFHWPWALGPGPWVLHSYYLGPGVLELYSKHRVGWLPWVLAFRNM